MSTQRYVVRHKSDRWNAEVVGTYLKLGGGYTSDLQQAQVLGWTKSGLKEWRRYAGIYDLIPVRVVLA